MDKLELILAQSVTSEMVAQHLTEEEVEEALEEVESEIEAADIFVEQKEEEILENRVNIDRVKVRKKRLTHIGEQLRDGLIRLQQQQKESPNQKRAQVIRKAKRFIKKCESTAKSYGYDVRYAVNKGGRGVSVMLLDNGRIISLKSAQCHPVDVWNKHIGKAIAFGRALGINIREFEDVPQPTEIVPGMDVELSGVSGNFYASGRVMSYCEERDTLVFLSIYNKGENVLINDGYVVIGVRTDGFKITSDTKAKYNDE